MGVLLLVTQFGCVKFMSARDAVRQAPRLVHYVGRLRYGNATSRVQTSSRFGLCFWSYDNLVAPVSCALGPLQHLLRARGSVPVRTSITRSREEATGSVASRTVCSPQRMPAAGEFVTGCQLSPIPPTASRLRRRHPNFVCYSKGYAFKFERFH